MRKNAVTVPVPEILRRRFYLPATMDRDLLAAFASLPDGQVDKDLICNLYASLISSVAPNDVPPETFIGFRLNGGDLETLIGKNLPGMIKYVMALAALAGSRTPSEIDKICTNGSFRAKAAANKIKWAIIMLENSRRFSAEWRSSLKLCRECAQKIENEDSRADAFVFIGHITRYARDFAPAVKLARSKNGADKLSRFFDLVHSGCRLPLSELEDAAAEMGNSEESWRQLAYNFLAQRARGRHRALLYLESFRAAIDSEFAEVEIEKMAEFIEVFAAMGTGWSRSFTDLLIRFFGNSAEAMMIAYEASRESGYLESARRLARTKKTEDALFNWLEISRVTGHDDDLRRLRESIKAVVGMEMDPLSREEVGSYLLNALVSSGRYEDAIKEIERIEDNATRDRELSSCALSMS